LQVVQLMDQEFEFLRGGNSVFKDRTLDKGHVGPNMVEFRKPVKPPWARGRRVHGATLFRPEWIVGGL
jgi:hypothetical protein